MTYLLCFERGRGRFSRHPGYGNRLTSQPVWGGFMNFYEREALGEVESLEPARRGLAA
jgi:hypothetical protein